MRRLSLTIAVLGAAVLFAALFIGIAPGTAAERNQEGTPDPNLSIGDDYCLSCHGSPGQTYPLEDGSALDLYVDPLEHAGSIHGEQGYACVQCHAEVGKYPHPPFAATDRRDVTLQLNEVCSRCHLQQSELAQDSVHATAMAAGNRNAAVCSDCHTAHNVQDWVDEQTGETLQSARLAIPQTCAQCHNEIYQKYSESVHGSALTQENNPDVPTCIDCHGVHNIEDPTTAEFRLASPQMCANCHTDPAIMTKYGISTNVLNTYVADFHGTTVDIFEKQSPDAETNKPVCYDCHGVHDIKRADDPEKGLQVQANLLNTCQKCHPDAQDNFPTAWLSHYIPSPEKYPLVYYVNLFYKIFIPTVLGGMAILVVLDFSRMTINRRRRRQHERSATALDADQQPGEVSETPAVDLPSSEAGETAAADQPSGESGEPEALDQMSGDTGEMDVSVSQEPLADNQQATSKSSENLLDQPAVNDEASGEEI